MASGIQGAVPSTREDPQQRREIYDVFRVSSSLQQNIKGLFNMYSGTEGALQVALLYSSLTWQQPFEKEYIYTLLTLSKSS